MELWIPAIAVVGVYALALISPGPNFLVITRSALAYSRPIGLRTALGVASGSILWISFGIFGVAAIFSQVPLLFTIVKVIGAAYLLFGALKLTYKQLQRRTEVQHAQAAAHKLPANAQAFRHGFLTQMSNPKAAVFILALFSSAVSPATPVNMKLSMALAMVAMSFSWYLLVAAIFAQSNFQTAYKRFQRPANLGVHLYRQEAAEGESQICRSCHEPFASRLQVEDLKTVLPQVGFDYTIGDDDNWQDTCPRCRRREVALAQTERVEGFG